MALGAVSVTCGCRAPEEVTRRREAQWLPRELNCSCAVGSYDPTLTALPPACQKLILPEKLEKTKGKPQRLEQASETTPLQSAYQHTGHRVGGETHAMAVDSL